MRGLSGTVPSSGSCYRSGPHPGLMLHDCTTRLLATLLALDGGMEKKEDRGNASRVAKAVHGHTKTQTFALFFSFFFFSSNSLFFLSRVPFCIQDQGNPMGGREDLQSCVLCADLFLSGRIRSLGDSMACASPSFGCPSPLCWFEARISIETWGTIPTKDFSIKIRVSLFF